MLTLDTVVLRGFKLRVICKLKAVALGSDPYRDALNDDYGLSCIGIADGVGYRYGCRNLGNGKAEIYGAMNVCNEIEKRLGIKVNREPEENWTWVSKAYAW